LLPQAANARQAVAKNRLLALCICLPRPEMVDFQRRKASDADTVPSVVSRRRIIVTGIPKFHR
jgi:hypothetical protein